MHTVKPHLLICGYKFTYGGKLVTIDGLNIVKSTLAANLQFAYAASDQLVFA